MRSWFRLGILGPLCLCVGCSSLQTTFFKRQEDDTLCKENHTPIHGVPVMVQVPTHLELRVDETVHLVRQPGTTAIQVLAPSGNIVRSVDAKVRMTEKMFVVDPKRPFSGTAAYGFTFQSRPKANSNLARANAGESAGHGYLQGLKYKADDQTITNVSTFLANIAPLLASPVASLEDAPKDPLQGVYTTNRTIAFGLFDLASPTFEEEVNDFLELHINQCAPCVGNSSIYSETSVRNAKE